MNVANESPASAARLSEIYPEALPEVFGYLRRRCGSETLAEELTSSVFIRAALAVERGTVNSITIAWLITIARHRLVDHWRHQAVVDRTLVLLEGGKPEPVNPWDEVLDVARAEQVLQDLKPHYRAALTLRYLDDLSVGETAESLGRSVRGTESLLARARNSFRARYEETGGEDA